MMMIKLEWKVRRRRKTDVWEGRREGNEKKKERMSMQHTKKCCGRTEGEGQHRTSDIKKKKN